MIASEMMLQLNPLVPPEEAVVKPQTIVHVKFLNARNAPTFPEAEARSNRSTAAFPFRRKPKKCIRGGAQACKAPRFVCCAVGVAPHGGATGRRLRLGREGLTRSDHLHRPRLRRPQRPQGCALARSPTSPWSGCRRCSGPARHRRHAARLVLGWGWRGATYQSRTARSMLVRAC